MPAEQSTERSAGSTDAAGTSRRIIVVGAGIAGLSAAVAAAEELADTPGDSVILVDRAGRHEAGGNSRWTSAYFRLEDLYETGESFVQDVVGFSGGRTPTWYAQELARHLPETMEWIQGHGARFRRSATYFISSNRPRLMPVGGGEGLLEALRRAADRLGVRFRYGTTAQRLLTDDAGRVTGLVVTGEQGEERLAATAVIIASGGFEGDLDSLRDALGAEAGRLLPIAPGVAFNKGEGIRMALAAGARPAGQWDGFHAEPVDPRSTDPEALVMVFPYGILVNRNGERFVDEGRGTVDETYESIARAAWSQPGGIAYLITDQHFGEVSDRDRGILTSVKPITADSVPELAAALGLAAERLSQTIADYNAAAPDGKLDWRRPDGNRTVGLEPPKSNWALPLDRPPFTAYPVACAIVFTFGGLDTDERARVVGESAAPIPGLYAAGECTGVYHGKYPGGTSVMRGMVFGRIAGRAAASERAGDTTNAAARQASP